MKGFKVREFTKLLIKHGWQPTNRKGNHIILEKDGFEKHISIPNHKGKELCRPMTQRLLEEAGILS